MRFWFKQPLIGYITSAVFTRRDIARLYLRIQTIVARARIARAKAAQGDWSMANPTSPLCSFCANLGECDKVLEFACQVGKKYHPLGLPSDINPSLVTDPANIQIAMELEAVLKTWCGAFRRRVTDRVLRGESPVPPGFNLQVMQKRELVDLKKYKEAALKRMTEFEWESCLDTTFGAVEKLIQEKATRGNKKAAVEEFQAEAAALGATKLGQPSSFLKVKYEKQAK